jgi:hypothetical protein
MKSSLLFIAFLSLHAVVKAQNEFAANGFYRDLVKISEDAQLGFPENRGKKITSRYESLNEEYQPNWPLPLADSGRVVFPKTMQPFVVYYFEPAKHRLPVDQKGSNLRDAIAMAIKKPLFSRSETILVGNVPVTNTWIFDTENESRHSAALYLLSVYQQNGKFYLSLQINGKKPAGTP